MKIIDILQPYKYFFLATKEDNEGILNFFNSITMDTKSFSLRYDRGTDFFKFSNEQSANSFTFIMKDEKGNIRGTASLALIPHFLNGKKELCAYLGDLRISPLLSPKIRINWKKCYSEIIANFSNIEEFKGVKYLYSAILDENQNAMRSLLKNNDQLIYHHLTAYETYNVITPSPLAFLWPDKYQVMPVDFSEINNFLINNSSKGGLTNYFVNANESESLRRINTWENFSEKSFLSVKNQSGKIVAVFAPWQCHSKKLVIEKMSRSQKILSYIMPLFKIPSLKEKEAVNVLYLTNLTFANDLPKDEFMLIIHSSLMYLFKQKRNFHTISFFTYPQWELKKMPFFIEKTKANFYQVMSKRQYDEKEFIELKNTPPSFEIGIS